MFASDAETFLAKSTVGIQGHQAAQQDFVLGFEPPLEMTSDARSILCNGDNVTCACRCMRVTVMIALAHASSGRLLHEDTRQDKTSLLKIVTKNKLHPLVNQFTEFST